jgi:hypothetical protein
LLIAAGQEVVLPSDATLMTFARITVAEGGTLVCTGAALPSAFAGEEGCRNPHAKMSIDVYDACSLIVSCLFAAVLNATSVSISGTLRAHGVTILASQSITLTSSGRIDVDGAGHVPGEGVGAGVGAGADYVGGAAHGGGGFLSTRYGEYAAPTRWGSGGAGATTHAGAGGGAVRLSAPVIELQAGSVISADGKDSTSAAHGSGAGGSVWVEASERLTGGGALYARGGRAAGGGRIALSPTGEWAGTFSVVGPTPSCLYTCCISVVGLHAV